MEKYKYEKDFYYTKEFAELINKTSLMINLESLQTRLQSIKINWNENNKKKINNLDVREEYNDNENFIYEGSNEQINSRIIVVIKSNNKFSKKSLLTLDNQIQETISNQTNLLSQTNTLYSNSELHSNEYWWLKEEIN